MKHPWFISILLALLILALAACGTSETISEDPTSLEDGAVQEIDPAEIFAARCARCHEEDRTGKNGPALLPERLTKESADYQAIIKDGFKGMPAFSSSLSSEEINALVEFILSEPQ